MNTYQVFLDAEHSIYLKADAVYEGSAILLFQVQVNQDENPVFEFKYKSVGCFNLSNIKGYILVEDKEKKLDDLT